VPEHQDTPQLRAAGDGRRDPRRGAPVRAQDQRLPKPSKANEAAFERAVEEVAASSMRLLHSLVTAAPPRNREVEAERARERARKRFPAAAA
jgi:Uncharacterized conserved protein